MATIESFKLALAEPKHYLSTLTEAICDGGIAFRTTHFAQAEIVWREERYLLSMPLSQDAAERAERVEHMLFYLRREWLRSYNLLPGEMLYINHAGEPRRRDLILERLPEGVPLTSAEDRLTCAAIDLLEREFRDADFSHGNIKPSNLYIDQRGVLHPIRPHYAKKGASEDEFKALREHYGALVAGDSELCYDHSRTYMGGHKQERPPHEGLICVEDESGYGFVDMQGRSMIPSIYEWAGDFYEGRAEVQIEGRMGLIDRGGNYIIPPIYQIVEHDIPTSLMRVKLDEKWAIFNYSGVQITPFCAEYITEEQLTKKSQYGEYKVSNNR
ncbi:MAG: WG repeat-containing protein [Rikenellaceae bacterium]